MIWRRENALAPVSLLGIRRLSGLSAECFAAPERTPIPAQAPALTYPLAPTCLAPFILGGGGWSYTPVKDPDGFEDRQNRFGQHAGGGLQFFLNRLWSLDDTYRYIWLEKE